MITDPPRRYTILFDGFCNLCDGLTAFVIARDVHHEFHFIPLQSDEGKALLETHRLGQKYLSSLVLIDSQPSPRAYVRSEAAIRTLAALPGALWKYAKILLLAPAPLRDAVYNAIASLRYKLFGKKEVCDLRPRRRHS
jgi:predicted DCC family thiol-disulfide oxidoreductase YuxK